MPETSGKHIISSLGKKWKINTILSHLFTALAITFIAFTILYKVTGLSFLWTIPLFVLIFLLFLFLKQQWKISEWDVSRFLNKQYPQLEESVHLVITPVDKLNFLQKLQAQKIENVLADLSMPKQLNQKLRSSLLVLLVAFLISLIVLKLPVLFSNRSANFFSVSPLKAATQPIEKVLPEIAFANIKIIPPAYTGKSSREQASFNLLVEEGGTVVWHLRTTIASKKVTLLLNDRQFLLLSPLDEKHTTWSCTKSVTHNGFYQVAIDNKISEFYKLEIAKDLPPVITVQSPGPNTVIDPGMPESVTLSMSLSDDYGIANTSVYATISSGSGEAVKFKEQQLTFPDFKSGNVKYTLKKLLDLKSLGMQPGDELYFYIKAIDNHNQEKRSDVYIVNLADTAQLMSMEGMLKGIDLKPEYFRSERQIIIETEQLLKDRDTVTVLEFNNRSNNLGIDQKLLRLRYGKFLGEENEVDIAGGHDEAGHNDAADFGNAAKVIDEYAHKHDNAEDASFFEPELKAQLKATLSEMWKAELQLRINKPKVALPFEYKALKLLKDLQQKSRVYVAKTGFKTTPLKPEKRLTGELDKITEPVNHQQVEQKPDVYESARKAAGLLGLLKTGRHVSPEAFATLQQLTAQLYSRASEHPSVYLPAVSSINKILTAIKSNRQPNTSDINAAETALQKMLSVPAKLPVAGRNTVTENLSDKYFKNLNKGRQ